MKRTDGAALTRLLQSWRNGDEEAANKLLRGVYGDLRRIAGSYMRNDRASHTLQATALVHEAWMRLSRGPSHPVANREQFFRAMAAHMRRQLVDHALVAMPTARSRHEAGRSRRSRRDVGSGRKCWAAGERKGSRESRPSMGNFRQSIPTGRIHTGPSPLASRRPRPR